MYKRLNFTKRHSQIFIFFLLYISSLTSQNTDLSILSIPDSLKYKANAVIRFENMNIELKSSSKMIIQKEVAVTILNKSGNEDGYVELYYDNHRHRFTVDSKPEDISLTLPENLGVYNLNIKVNGNTIQINSKTMLNTAILGANYYQHLKEFYKRAIDNQLEKIVLKQTQT